ncbi:MAG: SDR family oxidoreductase, partial [Myxococcales bacterium]|nr:SDR family oxidoreductase [Myxococcales bacterium]
EPRPARPELDARLFPPDSNDGHAQPLDLRIRNSWRLRVHEVATRELLEVQLINAIAPYLLVARLRDFMARAGGPADRFIVNVSAVEGQFTRAFKSDLHPHTNMAKAALNMLTRTSARDLARQRVYMTSVDTGWVTNENPHPLSARMADDGFSAPLDELDGAARVLDPVFTGIASGAPVFGVFFKDYAPAPW